uniref:hypothetical protein n=1 Tax=Noviherbaspirillum soli TaxID=1064518 RepID=UPI00188D6336|nr:hypothetical protein [Noviherbaspirillum soli]
MAAVPPALILHQLSQADKVAITRATFTMQKDKQGAGIGPPEIGVSLDEPVRPVARGKLFSKSLT